MKVIHVKAYRRRKGQLLEAKTRLPDLERATARMMARGKVQAEAYRSAFDGSLPDSWDCGPLAGTVR